MVEETNFDAARVFVDYGLDQQRNGRRESASGPGSALAASAQTLELLDRTVEELSIRTILDLGCGDWNWMKEAAWYRRKLPIEYIGWEANLGLVRLLEGRFGRPGISFHVRDIVLEPLPPVDLIICRDVLFHLPIRLAMQVVEKVARMECLFMASTFPKQKANTDIVSYLPIDNWGFYRINLDLAPFSLNQHRVQHAIEPLCGTEHDPREICLYDFTAVSQR